MLIAVKIFDEFGNPLEIAPEGVGGDGCGWGGLLLLLIPLSIGLSIFGMIMANGGMDAGNYLLGRLGLTLGAIAAILIFAFTIYELGERKDRRNKGKKK